MNPRSEKKTTVQPRLRARLKQLAADAILEAAEEVFADVGPAAGMEQIATRAGVAVGTLYNHFKDRDALVDALFEVRHAALLDRVEKALDESNSQPARDRFVAALGAAVSSTTPNARFHQLFMQAEQRKPRRQGLIDRLRAAMAPVFEQARREKLLPADPAGMQSTFLFALLRGALSASYEAPERLPREEIARVVVKQFLDGARA